MSTPYQVLFGRKGQIEDIEDHFRFYKKRNLAGLPQSELLYEIFKESMSGKINSFTIINIIFVTFSVIYYEIVIEMFSSLKPALIQMNKYHYSLLESNDEA